MKLNHQQKAAFRESMNRANAQMEMGNLFACAAVLEALLNALEELQPGLPAEDPISPAAPGANNPPPGGAAPGSTTKG